MITKYPYITVTKGMAGFFAVKIWWNPDGFEEPYDTGDGRYALQAEAIDEAQEWAACEEIPFVEPSIDDQPTRQDALEQLREIIPDIQVIYLDDGAGTEDANNAHKHN